MHHPAQPWIKPLQHADHNQESGSRKHVKCSPLPVPYQSCPAPVHPPSPPQQEQHIYQHHDVHAKWLPVPCITSHTACSKSLLCLAWDRIHAHQCDFQGLCDIVQQRVVDIVRVYLLLTLDNNRTGGSPSNGDTPNTGYSITALTPHSNHTNNNTDSLSKPKIYRTVADVPPPSPYHHDTTYHKHKQTISCRPAAPCP